MEAGQTGHGARWKNPCPYWMSNPDCPVHTYLLKWQPTLHSLCNISRVTPGKMPEMIRLNLVFVHAINYWKKKTLTTIFSSQWWTRISQNGRIFMKDGWNGGNQFEDLRSCILTFFKRQTIWNRHEKARNIYNHAIEYKKLDSKKYIRRNMTKRRTMNAYWGKHIMVDDASQANMWTDGRGN